MSAQRDETEWLQRGFAVALPTDKPRQDCPPAERILQGVRKQLPRMDLKRLLVHIAECPVCTESWRLAQELEGRKQRPRRLWPAAAALIGAAAVLMIVLFVPEPNSIPRNPGEGATLELLISQPLPRQDAMLRWNALQNARYDIRVFTSNLELITQQRNLAEPEFRIPEDDLQAVPSGDLLRVHIEAHRPGQGRIAGKTSRVLLQ